MNQFFPGCQCCQEPFGDGDLFHRLGDFVVCYRCVRHVELRPCRRPAVETLEETLKADELELVGDPGCR